MNVDTIIADAAPQCQTPSIDRLRSSVPEPIGRLHPNKSNTPNREGLGVCIAGCLTMTYFRMGSPHYHRRAAVSRSCSGWEGVVPAGYGRQALTVGCPRVRGQPHSEEAKH